MTGDVVSAGLPYGPLELHETYFQHDGPKFFSLRAKRFPMYLLALCVDETDSTLSFLYLAVAENRFKQIRAGHVSLLDAFQDSIDGEVWLVTEDYSERPGDPYIQTQAVRLEELPEDYLPLPEARMNLPTPTERALDHNELIQLATASLRFVAAIELDAHGENLTEFPLRGLGTVGTALQDSVDALAQEEYGEATDRGPIAKRITDNVQMSAIGLRAASFALVIGTDKQGAMLETPGVEATLNRLVDLISAGTEDDSLLPALQNYGARARAKFTNLLRAVHAHESGIGVLTAPLRSTPRSARMSAGEVMRALLSIEQFPPARNELSIRRGTLIGSNTRRGTFELIDNATMARYSGTVAPEARSMIDGLAVGNASYVSATLSEEIEFAAEDQETGRRYTLMSIAPVRMA